MERIRRIIEQILTEIASGSEIGNFIMLELMAFASLLFVMFFVWMALRR